jgi:hypothetical protein
MRSTDTQARILTLKNRARVALQHYRLIGSWADCGNALLQHISPEAAEAAAEVDAAMAELARIDPACPKWTPLSAG